MALTHVSSCGFVVRDVGFRDVGFRDLGVRDLDSAASLEDARVDGRV